jgi:hypothetical protein
MPGLHSVASAGRVREMGRILSLMSKDEKREKINSFNRHGFTPLHSALFHDHYEMVELLLKNGADATCPANREHWTFPLHLAAIRGTVRLIRLLLNAGADPFLCDWDGALASQIASTSDNKHTATYLQQQMKVRKKPIGFPDWTSFSNEMKDSWWRVTQPPDSKEAKTKSYPDHFSDGGTPAPVYGNLELNHQELMQPLLRRSKSRHSLVS